MILVRTLATALIMSCTGLVSAQNTSHPLENIEQQRQTEPKNTVVFIHTDWCGYCGAMLHKTFTERHVKNLLENQFYFAELNAEEKKPLMFAGRQFRFKPTGNGSGYHELATALGSENGQLIFPVLVILNPRNEIIYRQTGFLSASDMQKVLRAFSQG